MAKAITKEDEFIGNAMRPKWRWEDPQGRGSWSEQQGCLEMNVQPGQGGDMNVPRLSGGNEQHLTLHLFYDKSVMELFINGGRQIVTWVAYPASNAPLRVECRAIGSEARITTLDIWSLKAVWPTTG